MITEFLVTAGETRKRLDLFLLNRERDMTRSHLHRLIHLGRIRLNEQVVKPGHKIKPGDRITWDTPQPGPLLQKGQPVTLEIVFEDEALLVVNKPPGIVIHPTSGNWTGTLLNAVLAHIQGRDQSTTREKQTIRPGIVHRLDKDTSGVVVMAKTEQAHRGLVTQFERHSIHRSYEAVIWSVPEREEGLIDLAIGRDRFQPQLVSSDSHNPKRAVTAYQVIKRTGESAVHVRLTPQTGRTHQLRVHMASIGCPILGDQTYGGPQVCNLDGINIPRVMLHARMLAFRHPLSGRYQEFSVELPADIQTICQLIARDRR